MMTNTPGRKQTIGVIFGSRSVEHDVSIVTAQQVMQAMSPAKYEVVPIYITRSGKWLTGPMLSDLKTFQAADVEELMGIKETVISPSVQHHGMITPPIAGYLGRNNLQRLDAVFPVIHGTHGEDGTLQGVIEMADIPYVGCGVLASAVANDKIMTKAILREHGLPVLDYIAIRRQDWLTNRDAVLDHIESRLPYPLFVKPATLGSSIGIGRPPDRQAAVAVLEQPISYEEFLTYEEKYMHGGGAKGMKGAERKIPAPLPPEMTEHIRQMAIDAFKAIDGRGTSRIDFLVRDSEVYINEINTMPGSLALYLWQEEGMSPAMVVDELIRLAADSAAEKRRTMYDYRSGLVAQAAAHGLKGLKGIKGLKGGNR
jgi:D-alanine-D-alanine ligase